MAPIQLAQAGRFSPKERLFCPAVIDSNSANQKVSRMSGGFDRKKAERALSILKPLLGGGPRYARPATQIMKFLRMNSLHHEEASRANQMVEYVIKRFALDSIVASELSQHSEKVQMTLDADVSSERDEQIQTITLYDLWCICKKEKPLSISTVRGWKNQVGFPLPISQDRHSHTFPRNKVLAWVRVTKGINV